MARHPVKAVGYQLEMRPSDELGFQIEDLCEPSHPLHCLKCPLGKTLQTIRLYSVGPALRSIRLIVAQNRSQRYGLPIRQKVSVGDENYPRAGNNR